MSTLKRIRRVTIETERTFVFRTRGVRETAWCARCGAEIEMVGADAAAQEAGMSELAMYQLLGSGQLHVAETAQGHVLVCLNSLREAALTVELIGEDQPRRGKQT